ncbi:hypothetical protein KEM55_007312, partial [Ascosphaera atra]
DLIRRLGPSLKKHKKCDIIDIFPGTGLLSSKLHKALSPRRHLLLEPNFKNFKPFLTPLLEKSRSRYHHLDYDPFNLATYSRLFEEGHLPEQTEKAEVDGLNNSLLITANLTHHEPAGLSRGILFMRFMEACLDKSLFNSIAGTGRQCRSAKAHIEPQKNGYPRRDGGLRDSGGRDDDTANRARGYQRHGIVE